MATHVGLETVERRTAVTIQDPTHTTPPTPPPPPTNKKQSENALLILSGFLLFFQ